MHCLTALGAVGSTIPAMHCRIVWGQWAAELLQCTAPLPGGSGQWTSGNTLPHCLGCTDYQCKEIWPSVGKRQERL